MSVLGIIDIGTSALTAQKTALDVTSQNISNVNTPGYSRQTAILESSPAGYDGFQAATGGVRVSTITRSYDQFLMSQITSESSSNGQLTTMQSALQNIQSLFSNSDTSGLGVAMQNFFNAWQDLSMNPQGVAERQTVLSTAQTLVGEFHNISDNLNSVKSLANQSLTTITSDINQKTQQIAALNEQIVTAEQTGSDCNALLDSRDQLIKDLAGKVGISYYQNQDGSMAVNLAGGPSLVQGNSSATLSLSVDSGNSNYYNVIITPPNGGDSTDITPLLVRSGGSSGELGGTLALRDTTVNQFLSQLDELASTIANQVNSLHTAGYGLDGSTGINFFTPPPAPTPPATFTSGYSSTIGLNVNDINQIAAASSNPTATNSTGNNVNALQIANLNNLSLPMTGGSTTLTGFYSAMVGSVGLAAQTNQNDVTQSNAVLQQLNTMRNSSAGVSLDEELAGLVNYQKAFEGAAKLITTGQEMLDTILGMVH